MTTSPRGWSDKRFTGNQNTHFVFSNFFSENRAVDNVEKYCRAGKATDENMAHAHFMLDT